MTVPKERRANVTVAIRRRRLRRIRKRILPRDGKHRISYPPGKQFRSKSTVRTIVGTPYTTRARSADNQTHDDYVKNCIRFLFMFRVAAKPIVTNENLPAKRHSIVGGHYCRAQDGRSRLDGNASSGGARLVSYFRRVCIQCVCCMTYMLLRIRLRIVCGVVVDHAINFRRLNSFVLITRYRSSVTRTPVRRSNVLWLAGQFTLS